MPVIGIKSGIAKGLLKITHSSASGNYFAFFLSGGLWVPSIYSGATWASDVTAAQTVTIPAAGDSIVCIQGDGHVADGSLAWISSDVIGVWDSAGSLFYSYNLTASQHAKYVAYSGGYLWWIEYTAATLTFKLKRALANLTGVTTITTYTASSVAPPAPTNDQVVTSQRGLALSSTLALASYLTGGSSVAGQLSVLFPLAGGPASDSAWVGGSFLGLGQPDSHAGAFKWRGADIVPTTLLTPLTPGENDTVLWPSTGAWNIGGSVNVSLQADGSQGGLREPGVHSRQYGWHVWWRASCSLHGWKSSDAPRSSDTGLVLY